MKYSPKNPNSSLVSQHALYVAYTGGGKSVLLRNHLAQLGRDARVILWDQPEDHTGLHCDTKQKFIKALKAARKRGGGYRIAFSGMADIANYEWFCEVVWSILDGGHLTYMVVEEVAGVSPNANEASPNAKRLMYEGRKYGLVFMGTTQKPQATSKTYYDMCAIKYIGQQKTIKMCKRMAEEIGMDDPNVIRSLEPLEFFHDDGTVREPQKIKAKYRAASGVKHMK